ncbi:MAG: polysaccharide biosynthesis/export family protein [Planctomycetota bacterium]
MGTAMWTSVVARKRLYVGLALLASVPTSGCHLMGPKHSQVPHEVLAAPAVAPAPPNTVPRELQKTILPTYTIEPPDILRIEAVHIVPRPPYRLRTFDSIAIQVPGALTEAPIAGVFPVELGGAINLGPPYGSVRAAGLTLDEAKAAIEQHLAQYLKLPAASVSLVEIAAQQYIAGEHLVGPDGTVNLGTYGTVCVVGLTLVQAKAAIEAHLTQYLEDPEVAVDVFAYNSKTYYVVTQGAGLGDALYRFPVTGNETVLDALSQINGLSQTSSKRIWIARPTSEPGCVQVLPVDWNSITAQGTPGTNYQIMPGDRLFVAEDKLIALDTAIAKLTSPFERVMGFSLLGVGTVTRFSGPVLQGGGNSNSGF